MKLTPPPFLFLILLGIASCEKDFIAPIQESSGKMVVNSLFNDGGPMTVYLTTSYSLNNSNTNITAIADAQIELYQDSVFMETLHYVPSDSLASFGAYWSNLTPQAGKTYTIKMTEPTYGQCSASDQIPVPAQNASCQLAQYSDVNGQGNAIVNLTFTDNPGVENYYRINTWLYGEYNDQVNPQGDTTYNYYAIRPNLLTPLNDTVWDNEVFLLFSDRGFNGQTKEVTMNFQNFLPDAFSHLTLIVQLHTVSYAHYEYFKTLQVYESTNYTNNASPASVYSNIQNGYGIFAGEHWESTSFVIR